MPPYFRRCWAEIHLDRLLHNLACVRAALPAQTEVMAVVKADAYGHGANQIAAALQDAGVGRFAVSNLEEAVALRQAGIAGTLLILGPTPPEQIGALTRYNITQTVHTLEYARTLNDRTEKPVDVHLKIDTGMGRIGFDADGTDFAALAAELHALPRLRIRAAFSHLSHADCDDEDARRFTERQQRRFAAATEALKAVFPELKTHLQNSAGIFDYRAMRFDGARPGIVLYGLPPSEQMHSAPDLQPILELKSCITQIKTIAPDTPVGYGRRFVADRPVTVATVPVGYADGYPRLLSAKGVMLVRGQRAPVIGNVCMDQVMLDVTGIDGVQTDDTVTVYGQDGDAVYGVADAARAIGTIPYELVCSISKRVPRVYLNGGKIQSVCDFILDSQRGDGVCATIND